MPISLWSNSARGIREGQQGFIEVRVTDSLGRPAPAGTLLSYSISGSGITQSDFYVTPLSGQVVVGNNGIARLAIYTEIDRVVDSESFNVSFTNRTYSSSGFSVNGSIIDVQPVTPPVTPPPVTPPPVTPPPANTATQGADTYTGTSGANTFNGLGGNDYIDGAGGNDTLNGSSGNDTVLGGAGDDLLIGGAGDDLVDGGSGINTASYADATAGVTVTLATSVAQNTVGAGVDRLVNIQNLTGSSFADTLTGNAGNNDISGLGGDDFLYGGAGADRLIGGDGVDRLYGDAGGDRLTGGAGSDFFIFRSVADSTPIVGSSDTIVDFTKGADKIDLSLIDANRNLAGDQAFTFIGTAAFSGVAGQLGLVINGRQEYYIQGDTNGDRIADFEITFANNPLVSSADFIL